MGVVAAVVLEILVASLEHAPVIRELLGRIRVLAEEHAILVADQEVPSAERDATQFVQHCGNVDMDVGALVEQGHPGGPDRDRASRMWARMNFTSGCRAISRSLSAIRSSKLGGAVRFLRGSQPQLEPALVARVVGRPELGRIRHVNEAPGYRGVRTRGTADRAPDRRPARAGPRRRRTLIPMFLKNFRPCAPAATSALELAGGTFPASRARRCRRSRGSRRPRSGSGDAHGNSRRSPGASLRTLRSG